MLRIWRRLVSRNKCSSVRFQLSELGAQVGISCGVCISDNWITKENAVSSDKCVCVLQQYETLGKIMRINNHVMTLSVSFWPDFFLMRPCMTSGRIADVKKKEERTLQLRASTRCSQNMQSDCNGYKDKGWAYSLLEYIYFTYRTGGAKYIFKFHYLFTLTWWPFLLLTWKSRELLWNLTH